MDWVFVWMWTYNGANSRGGLNKTLICSYGPNPYYIYSKGMTHERRQKGPNLKRAQFYSDITYMEMYEWIFYFIIILIQVIF